MSLVSRQTIHVLKNLATNCSKHLNFHPRFLHLGASWVARSEAGPHSDTFRHVVNHVVSEISCSFMVSGGYKRTLWIMGGYVLSFDIFWLYQLYLFLSVDKEKATHPPKYNLVESINAPSRAAIPQLSRGVFLLVERAGSVFLWVFEIFFAGKSKYDRQDQHGDQCAPFSGILAFLWLDPQMSSPCEKGMFQIVPCFHFIWNWLMPFGVFEYTPCWEWGFRGIRSTQWICILSGVAF